MSVTDAIVVGEGWISEHYFTTDAKSQWLCCFDGSPSCGKAEAMRRNRRARPPVPAPSAFAGFRFPPDVILLAVRWYLR